MIKSVIPVITNVSHAIKQQTNQTKTELKNVQNMFQKDKKETKKYKQLFEICNEQVDANNKHNNNSSEDTDFDAKLRKSKCFKELQKNLFETTRVAKASLKIVEKIHKSEKNLRLKLVHDLKFIKESLDKDKEYKQVITIYKFLLINEF
jgi:hypothetical protein